MCQWKYHYNTLHLIEAIIYRYLIDHTSRERVDPAAKVRGTREKEREKEHCGGGESRERGRGVGGEESAFHRQCHVF